MSRFNSEAYDKVFPRPEDPIPPVETAVETFRPTEDKLSGVDPDVKDPEPTVKAPVEDVKLPTDDVSDPVSDPAEPEE